MENKDIFLVPETAPTWRWGGGFWGKNVEKKMKILHAGVIFGKKKLKILHEGISIDHFQKVPFFTNI